MGRVPIGRRRPRPRDDPRHPGVFGLQPHCCLTFKLSTDPLSTRKRTTSSDGSVWPSHGALRRREEPDLIINARRSQPLLPRRPSQADGAARIIVAPALAVRRPRYGDGASLFIDRDVPIHEQCVEA